MPCWKVEFPLDLLEFPVNLLDFPLNFICNCGGLQCSCVLERSLDPREVDAIEGNSSTSVRTLVYSLQPRSACLRSYFS